ncbi:NPP1 family protein [Streptomyces sp. NPDC050988]|uniref:NPP1 family protein n=1 Tax=Streptomyces sp. NPDC050988 TaxID=3365637 RepID=UPI0037B6DFA5
MCRRVRASARVSLTLVSAVALVVALPGSVLPAPPTALPANADDQEKTYQPACGYDTDGCCPTPAIGPDGTVNAGTHALRAAHSADEPPGNDHHRWQYPALVGWNGYPAGPRDKLSAYDFGSADFGLEDADFAAHLTKAEPAGIAFDPDE